MSLESSALSIYTLHVSMMRKLSVGVVLLAVAATAYLFFSFHAAVREKRAEMESTRIALLKSEHWCPKGTVDSVERWAMWGYSRGCRKNGERDGKWVAWEKQHKVIEGNYRDGKQQGLWIWFDDKGRITRKIQYEDGVEIRDSTPSSEANMTNSRDRLSPGTG